MSFLESLDPRVRDYLMKKREEEAALEQESQGGVMKNTVAPALAAISAGFMGKDPVSAGMSMHQNNAAQKKAVMDSFQKNKAGELEGINLSKQLVDSDRADEKYNRDKLIQAEDDDVNSQKSKMVQDLLRSMGVKDNVENMNYSRFKEMGPYYQKKLELEQKKQENYLNRIAKTDKEKEMSVAQAKQKGLFESGNLANSQYEAAIKAGEKDKKYDPTSYADWIDNSSIAPKWMRDDAAIEAEGAKSAWVESFLRDASGAAIPQPERLTYAKDYFPEPGDSAQAIQNKELLRKQKERNAKVASGDTSESPAAPQEEFKTVGSKKYKKVPGGWQEV